MNTALGLSGNELFEQVIVLTGLPEEQVATELTRLLGHAGTCPEQMTMEDLRHAILVFLGEVLRSENSH